MCSFAKIKNFDLQLPVKNNGEIDFVFMEKFITAVQKIVIKNVVDYKDRQISATKQVVYN